MSDIAAGDMMRCTFVSRELALMMLCPACLKHRLAPATRSTVLRLGWLCGWMLRRNVLGERSFCQADPNRLAWGMAGELGSPSQPASKGAHQVCTVEAGGQIA